MVLIRYPGSKEKLVVEIRSAFPDEMLWEMSSIEGKIEYREPFFGAGAVGMRVLANLHINTPIWLNDVDIGMASLWQAVHKEPGELKRRIAQFTPTTSAFYQFKEEDGRDDLPTAEIGFRKLALHRISFSGLGAMAGGPLGGREQTSKYNVFCRWRPERMQNEITYLHKRLSAFRNIQITHGDFEPLINDADSKCFVYLDPPYYEKGPQLYKHYMSEADHNRLCNRLRGARFNWVLSYDDHADIRNMYDWAAIREVELTYTMSTSKTARRPKNREVVITPVAA